MKNTSSCNFFHVKSTMKLKEKRPHYSISSKNCRIVLERKYFHVLILNLQQNLGADSFSLIIQQAKFYR